MLFSLGKFLGDQRLSYNQDLTFKLRLGEEQARASVLDVVIEGNGFMVSAPIYSQVKKLHVFRRKII